MHACYKTFSTSWYPAFVRFLGSRTALVLIAALFGIQAVWVVLTLRYPGAFDENFHLGLIRIYAHHWSPLLNGQPSSADAYGAVARDPSYLYHYLMSFPYRLIALLSDNQTVQIIVLRLINVALMVGGVFVFARALSRTPLSAPLRNAVLLFFTAIPIVPLMAGQISYDNLFLPLVALAMLWSFEFVRRLRDGTFDGRKLSGLLILCMTTSLVKYAFLPIFATLMFYFLFEIRSFRKRTGTDVSSLLRHSRPSKKPLYIVYATLLVVTGLLFTQRYGVNLALYHTPVPDCAQVLTATECQHYSPWGRDDAFAKANVALSRENVFVYSYWWLQQMMMELFFTVYGVFLPGNIVDYKVGMPVRMLIDTGWTVLIAGFTLSVLFASKLWRRYSGLRIIAVVSVVYTGSLLAQNYSMYIATAQPVAIHGRYILPLVPFMFAWFCLASWEALRYASSRIKFLKTAVPAIKAAGFVTLILLTTQGGGVITYIVRSDDTWVWQQNSHAQQAHRIARNILKLVVTE